MPVETNGDNRPTPNPRKLGGSLFSVLVYLLFFNLFILPLIRPSPKEVLYSRFLQELNEGKIAQALVEPNEIRYTLKSNDTKSSDGKTPATKEDRQSYVTTPIPSSRRIADIPAK